MSSRGLKAAAIAWVPIIGLVVALFVAPSGTGAGSAAPALYVTPGSGQYGGTKVTFSGDIGSGPQQIKLQRRGSPTSAWADVPDPRPGPNAGETFTFTTAANGSFSFTFPSPAMNEVYFRVAAVRGTAATEAHLFKSKHQDAEVSLLETLPVDVPLPKGIAVIGETYRLAIDTVSGAGDERKRVLPGRKVTLQVRDADDNWVFVVAGNLGVDGKVRFDRTTPVLSTQVYRVVLENWAQDGDQIGRFLSLPHYVTVVDRTKPVTAAAATAAPSGDSVRLTWRLPADPLRKNIVIARTGPGSEPTAANEAHIIATLAGEATQYNDTSLVYPGSTYKYAIYTRSADGVYSLLGPAQRLTVTTPVPPPPPKGGER